MLVAGPLGCISYCKLTLPWKVKANIKVLQFSVAVLKLDIYKKSNTIMHYLLFLMYGKKNEER